jgi:hypothetical protein
VIDIGLLRFLIENPDRDEPARANFAERGRLPSVKSQTNAGGVLPVHRAGTAHLPKRLDLMGQKNDLATLPESGSVISSDGQRRDVVQRGLKGN